MESRNRLLLVGNFLSAVDGRRTYAEDLAQRLHHAGYSVLCTSSRRARLPRLIDMVRTAARRQRYDLAIIDVYSGKAFAYAEAVSTVMAALGKPHLLALHGGSLPAFARRWPSRVRHLLKRGTAVVAPSEYLQHALSPFRPDILLLPNAISLGLYPYHLRRPLAPKLMWLRSFHEIYNPRLAVRVLKRLLQHVPEAFLTMVGADKGDGSLQRCRALAERLGVQHRILFSGPVPKESVGQTLAAADIFLNTTNIDNAPVSVIEAMACGMCIVTTNAGGVAQLVEDGREALLVDCDDEIAMAEQILELLRNDEMGARLSAAARSRAEQFDWKLVLPAWTQLLSSVSAQYT